MIALIGREEMDDHIAIIHDHPAIARFALFASLFMMLRSHGFHGGIRQRVQHTVAGAGAQDKIISKRGYVFYIEQENVFAFFIFQRADNRMCKFECVQKSPHIFNHR